MTDLGASPTATATAGPPAPYPRVVALAVTDRRRRKVRHMLEEIVRFGGEALLVTADGYRGEPAPIGVTQLDLLADERRWGPNRLLTVDPRRVVAKLIGRPGPQGAAPAWRRVVASRPYRVIRYWVLWRVARRHLDVLRPDQVTHVVVVGIESWPMAWQVMRRSPGATLGFNLPPELFVIHDAQP